jgi:quercetin dioxygenase-like cupin family protein
MREMGRRSVLVAGIAAAPALALSRPTAAATYGPKKGKEIAPGVRQVDLGNREAMIPGYKIVSMRDIVYQPGASSRNPAMKNDMVCHCLEGELAIDEGDGMQFAVKKDDVWSCHLGAPENVKNTGDTVAIMRVIDLLQG